MSCSQCYLRKIFHHKVPCVFSCLNQGGTKLHHNQLCLDLTSCEHVVHCQYLTETIGLLLNLDCINREYYTWPTLRVNGALNATEQCAVTPPHAVPLFSAPTYTQRAADTPTINSCCTPLMNVCALDCVCDLMFPRAVLALGSRVKFRAVVLHSY